MSPESATRFDALIPTISPSLSIHRVREAGCANVHRLPEKLRSQLPAQFLRWALHPLPPKEDPFGQRSTVSIFGTSLNRGTRYCAKWGFRMRPS